MIHLWGSPWGMAHVLVVFKCTLAIRCPYLQRVYHTIQFTYCTKLKRPLWISDFFLLVQLFCRGNVYRPGNEICLPWFQGYLSSCPQSKCLHCMFAVHCHTDGLWHSSAQLYVQTDSAHLSRFTVSSHCQLHHCWCLHTRCFELIIMSDNVADTEYVVEVNSVVPVTWHWFRNDTLLKNVQLKNCA